MSLKELINLLKALTLGSLTLGMVLFLLRVYAPFKAAPFPRSVLLVDYILTLFFIGALRISKRVFFEGLKSAFKLKKEKIRILIIGAGNAGEQISREMAKDRNSSYLPIGFVDDDPSKKGIKIHGLKVFGDRHKISEIIKNNNINEVLIALPSAHSKEIKNIVEVIRNSNKGVKIKILPSIVDLMDGKVTLSDIQEIELADLLGRAPVHIDFEIIKGFIENKEVLITGAGGSIGSELARSVLRFKPRALVLLEIDETEIFKIYNRLQSYETEIVPVVGDIKDKVKIDSLLQKYSPDVVFHAAAYKHVPIQEFYPDEAVKNNIYGTKVLAEASLEYGVDKFIYISTDKAVNPSSIMGATKRVGEELLKIYNLKNKTRFISVRFGNVLGSRGSVVEIFKEQIKKGGPVNVTHPEMRRYFMITAEAVLLVLEAAAVGEGGEVYVLDMGKHIKIIDLAKEMIRLSGYEPDKDIPIIFSHPRPGEKLYEEILLAEEGAEKTCYEKIFQVKSSNRRDEKELMDQINSVIEMGFQINKREDTVKKLKEIIPTYKPSEFKLKM